MSGKFRDLLRRTRFESKPGVRDRLVISLALGGEPTPAAVRVAAAWAAVQAGWCGTAEATVYEIAPDCTLLKWQVATSVTVGQLTEAIVKGRALARPVAGEDSVDVLWTGDWDRCEAGREGSAITLGFSATRSELIVSFDTTVIDRQQAEALLRSVSAVAQQMQSGPSQSVDELDLTGGDPPGVGVFDYDPAQTVDSIFGEIVAIHGDRTAVVHGDQQVTYRELDARATAVAANLILAGVQPGATVAIALERSIDVVAAFIGTLKAGCAFMPLDPAYPPDRFAEMIQIAQPRAAITDAAHRHVFAAELPVLLVHECVASNTVNEERRSTGDSVAYVMFTSGSTGKPKGVQVPHRSILRLVRGSRFANLSASCVMLQAAPLGFDASTLEIWGPLLNGGRCVLHDEEVPTPAGLARTITTNAITTAWLTSGLFNSVVDDDPNHLAGLEQLLIGGEALSVAHVRRFLGAQPSVELINGYGPTECTTFTTTYSIPAALAPDVTAIPIGQPIGATSIYVLSPSRRRLPAGIAGELYVGGLGVALGYVNDAQLTRDRFVGNSFSGAGDRLYRTGDLVRIGADGNIEFIGRADRQVKVRGFRIEPAEIESAIAAHPHVQACAVNVDRDRAGNARLIAYFVSNSGATATAVREYVAAKLPAPMVPAFFVAMSSLPLSVNGKVDRGALPPAPHDRPDIAEPFREPISDAERAICDAFSEALEISPVGRFDNFFDLGGNSLLTLRVLTHLERRGLKRLPPTAFFEQPTPAALARYLSVERPLGAQRAPTQRNPRTDDDAIAIVGMAGRFPGARNVEEFWQNLCDGRDTIRTFAAAELDPSIPPTLADDPSYVKRRGVLDDAQQFDAAFFGITPRAAELMDPQHRLFLELCWECLERAGHAPDRTQTTVGVFAGMYNASYFQNHLAGRPDLVNTFGEFQVMLANEKDYLASRVAHKLNLVGPAVSVYTACSTSLVAIAQAFASLRAGQCDLALAGGVSITCPVNSGYLHQEGAMLSPDGVTRTFDAAAGGTVFSDGGGVVLLKRLRDALNDDDHIHAVIRNVAVNNDGREKASFTAPSVAGQAAVVRHALHASGVSAKDVSYVEAHGTATPLGDPVEIEALSAVFRNEGAAVGSCRIGSLKSNMGHMVIASGVAGVMKTALALENELLPPTLHYTKPNPNIDFAGSPFVVNDRASAWPRGTKPRFAGVSSFGVGGTNAHAVLEEPPRQAPSSPAVGPQLLRLSARSAAALQAAAENLARGLETNSDINLADVAYTLQVGRSDFTERLSVVATSREDAVRALRTGNHELRALRTVPAGQTPLIWLLPGQGSQYARMGSGLYAFDPLFREALDTAFELMQKESGLDLRKRVLEGTADDLLPTSVAQPAIFCNEYALGRTLLQRGVQPSALIGHSVGEFAAAVLSGVMTLADGARLIAQRGALMQSMPTGSMLSVRLSAEDVLPYLGSEIEVAAINAPASCVVAGPTPAVARLEAMLASREVVATRLQTSHAFHSPMMDGVILPFESEVRKASLSPPTIPIISTVTGRALTAAEATDHGYWARQLRATVLCSQALQTALSNNTAAFLEIGPRATLSAFVRQHVKRGDATRVAINTFGDRAEDERAQFLLALGRLWTMGIEADAAAAFPAEGRRRIALPTYPFERQRYWIDAPGAVRKNDTATVAAVTLDGSIDMNKPVVFPTTVAPNSATAAPQALLVDELREMFENITGVDLAGADASVAFVELGMDSLSLTQAALQVKKQFKVPLTFRQLMEQYRSLATLAAFIADNSPRAAELTAAPTSPAVPVAHVPTAGSHNGDVQLVRDVIQQQMQLMNEQLAILRRLEGGNQATPAGSPVPTPATVRQAQPEPVQPAPKQTTYDVKKSFGAIARIHTATSDLTARQKIRLKKFIERYCSRTAKSKAYTTANRAHLADPRVVNGFRPVLKEITYQIVMERSNGSRLWDLDGNEYIDALNGFGMNLFGWRPDFVNDSVKAQLDAGYDIGPQHPLAGEVARLICDMTGNDRAGLCNTGSEAVMAAVRIARTVTGRNTLVVFTGSYHGTFDEVVVRAGKDKRGIPGAPGIMAGMYGDIRVLDYGTDESLEFIRNNAEDLAGVLVEPVQSRRPDFQPVEFLRELRKITEASGTCLIFDEVITGFRSAPGGTQQLFGVRADLAAYGKVIGGGFPIGAIAGKREYMDALDGGGWQYGDESIPTVGVTYFAGTFVRHPLALAAAKASLLELQRQGPDLQERLNRQTAEFAADLNAFCVERGAPIKIQHFASLWRVSWQEDHPLQDLLFAIMRDRGVHILDNFPCFMTTAHTAADLDLIRSAFKAAVTELQEAEFLPRAQETIIADASRPPVAGARLAIDQDGKPAWFVPDNNRPGKYTKHKPASVPAGA